MNLQFIPALADDATSLAELRVAAMRPSLEAVGRFDPQRARRRFLDTFRPEQTWKIQHEGELAGFFVVFKKPDHVWLDHLYVNPAMQNSGLGQQVLALVKAQATVAKQPLRLCALRDSGANGFYQKQGFTPYAEEEWDIYYQWLPA